MGKDIGISFTGKFSLLSAIAGFLFVGLVIAGELPWWSVFLAWLYSVDFIQVDLKKIFGIKDKGEDILK